MAVRRLLCATTMVAAAWLAGLHDSALQLVYMAQGRTARPGYLSACQRRANNVLPLPRTSSLGLRYNWSQMHPYSELAQQIECAMSDCSKRRIVYKFDEPGMGMGSCIHLWARELRYAMGVSTHSCDLVQANWCGHLPHRPLLHCQPTTQRLALSDQATAVLDLLREIPC